MTKTLPLIIVILAAFNLGCSGSLKSNSGPDANKSSVDPVELIVEIKYFKGGYYTADPVNWSHDMTLDFLKWNATAGAYEVRAKHPDPLCSKGGYITPDQVTQMMDIYHKMVLFTAHSPLLVVDAGEETIQVKTENGSVRRYHLMSTTAPDGEQYVENPQPIRDFLRALWESLPTACQ